MTIQADGPYDMEITGSSSETPSATIPLYLKYPERDGELDMNYCIIPL